MTKTAVLVSNRTPLSNKLRIFDSTGDTDLKVGDAVDNEYTVDAILIGVY